MTSKLTEKIHSKQFSEIALIIPALNPPADFLQFIKKLKKNFNTIIIINDGSEQKYNPIFSKIRKLDKGMIVINNDINGGKGFALKKAFAYVLDKLKFIEGVVTADCDGQHDIDSITNIAIQLKTNSSANILLGSRSFKKNVPFRSRFGNKTISFFFWLQTGKYFIDTQTGLRGIRTSYLDECLSITANTYEFEMDMLVKGLQKKLSIQTFPIQTIYIDGNKSSHFNPLIDSMKIIYSLFRYSSVALISAILDSLIFLIIFVFSSNVWFSSFFARFISTGLNFFLIRNFVFQSKENTILKFTFYLSYVTLMTYLCSYNIIYLINDFSMKPLTAKFLFETIFFLFNFFIMRVLIFGKK